MQLNVFTKITKIKHYGNKPIFRKVLFKNYFAQMKNGHFQNVHFLFS